MFRALESFTTGELVIQRKQLLQEDFTTEDEIQDLLSVGYIEVYDGTLEITENGQYNVKDYDDVNVNVSGGEVNLQSKNINITENGEQTITADTGYDGLSSLSISTNVSGGTSVPDWSEIGYSSVPNSLINNFNYSKTILNNWDNTQTDLSNKFKNDITIVYMPFVDTSNATSTIFMFRGCSNLEQVPLLDFSNVTNASSMFMSCSKLVEIPVFNFSSIITMNTPFNSCYNLSNNSLNNILETIVGMTNYTGTKTLQALGITSDQATICQTLSNWTACVNAGWTTGY